MTDTFDDRKARASAWFRTLRDDIVAAFEALEDSQTTGPFAGNAAGRFEVTETRRASDDGSDAGDGVDWDAALAIVQGDRESLGDVVDACLAELPELRRKLEASWKAGDLEGVSRYAHTVKGNFRTFGAAGISVAEQIENAAKSDQRDMVAEQMQPLLGAIQSTLNALSAFDGR